MKKIKLLALAGLVGLAALGTKVVTLIPNTLEAQIMVNCKSINSDGSEYNFLWKSVKSTRDYPWIVWASEVGLIYTISFPNHRGGTVTLQEEISGGPGYFYDKTNGIPYYCGSK